MSLEVLIIGNPLDDRTRAERNVNTDSPAASRKILMMARTLRVAGIRATILSLGRGRQDGSGRVFARSVRRIAGVPVVYLRFVHRPVVTKLVSAVEPISLLWRFHRRNRRCVVLFYNRMLGFAPALIAARVLGHRAVLDLEDGDVGYARLSTARIAAWLSRKIFDSLCNGGALLACSALGSMTSLEPKHLYYGVVAGRSRPRNFAEPSIKVLLGGTLAASTGAPLLAASIREARAGKSGRSKALHFIVTGYGESAGLFQELAQENHSPIVEYHGRVQNAEYQRLVDGSHVGLALKPATGILANSTFPSKVVELAGAGLLVVTTDISDVRRVLGAGALYLKDEEPTTLLETLHWITSHPAEAAHIAHIGAREVAAKCEPGIAGRRLARILSGHHA